MQNSVRLPKKNKYQHGSNCFQNRKGRHLYKVFLGSQYYSDTKMRQPTNKKTKNFSTLSLMNKRFLNKIFLEIKVLNKIFANCI